MWHAKNPRRVCQFLKNKSKVHEQWTMLFMIVLFIRDQCDLLNCSILPIGEGFHGPSSLSANSMSFVSSVDEIVSKIAGNTTAENSFPYAQLFVPDYCEWEEMDLIVAVWRGQDVRELYGYQLQEDKKQPLSAGSASFYEMLCNSWRRCSTIVACAQLVHFFD